MDLFIENILEIFEKYVKKYVTKCGVDTLGFESRCRCEENVSISSQIQEDEEICPHLRTFDIFSTFLAQVFITLFLEQDCDFCIIWKSSHTNNNITTSKSCQPVGRELSRTRRSWVEHFGRKNVEM